MKNTTLTPALNIITNKVSKPGVSPPHKVRHLMGTSLKVQKGLQGYQIELTIREPKTNV